MVAVRYNLQTLTADVSNAFFHAPEDEDVYAKPPPEWLLQRAAAGESVAVAWRLKKQLYGRRKAGQAWVEHAAKMLVDKVGLTRCAVAPYLFADTKRKMIVELHMDDIHATATTKGLDDLERALKENFKMKHCTRHSAAQNNDYEHLKRRRLRMKDGTLVVPGTRYVADVVEILGLETANTATTPTNANDKEEPNDKDFLDEERTRLYRGCVGSLLYVAHDRCDLQYAVKELGRDLKAPTERLWRNLKKAVRYAKTTTTLGIYFPRRDPEDENDHVSYLFQADEKCSDQETGSLNYLEVWSDANWAGCKESRLSTSGGVMLYKGCQLYSFSRTQTAIALSSAESEWYAATAATSEALHLHLKDVLDFVGERNLQIRLHLDSTAAAGIGQRKGVGKVRHLAARTLWLQDKVATGEVVIQLTKGEGNLADVNTKALTRRPLERMRDLCGLRDLTSFEDFGKGRSIKVSSFQGFQGATKVMAAITTLLQLAGAKATKDDEKQQEPENQNLDYMVIFMTIVLTLFVVGVVMGISVMVDYTQLYYEQYKRDEATSRRATRGVVTRSAMTTGSRATTRASEMGRHHRSHRQYYHHRRARLAGSTSRGSGPKRST